MPGIPTEHLAEQIEATNRRLVESQERIVEEVHELGRRFEDFRVEMAKEFGTVRSEVSREFAALRTEVSREFGAVRSEAALALVEVRSDVAREFGEVRSEVSHEFAGVRSELGKVTAAVERLGARVDHSISVAKWTIGIMAPVLLGLIGSAFWLTWYAAKLDSRVERIESHIKQEAGPSPSKPAKDGAR